MRSLWQKEYKNSERWKETKVLLVGGKFDRFECLVVGEAMRQACTSECHCKSGGETVISEDVYSQIEKYYDFVEAEGVIATVKHFAANNQEWSRHHASSDVDERTLHEIYFPAFRKAVEKAHVGAVMTSYNPVFGVHASENAYMNVEVLRNMWGFDGILMSDWTSVYSTSGAVNGGLDLECPKGVYLTKERIMPLIESGVISEETIDRKVYNILSTLDRFGLLDKPVLDESIEKDNPENAATALELAREGIVMLENRGGELPYGKRERVLVMGPNACVTTTGGGSGFVTPFHTVTVADGIKKQFGEKYVQVLSEKAVALVRDKARAEAMREAQRNTIAPDAADKIAERIMLP